MRCARGRATHSKQEKQAGATRCEAPFPIEPRVSSLILSALQKLGLYSFPVV